MHTVRGSSILELRVFPGLTKLQTLSIRDAERRRLLSHETNSSNAQESIFSIPARDNKPGRLRTLKFFKSGNSESSRALRRIYRIIRTRNQVITGTPVITKTGRCTWTNENARGTDSICPLRICGVKPRGNVPTLPDSHETSRHTECWCSEASAHRLNHRFGVK